MATARNRHSATSRPRLGEATCRQASQRSAAHIPPKRSAYAYAPRKSSPAAMAPAYAAKNATCSLRRCISVPLISAPLGIEARRQCQPEVQQLVAQPAHEEHVVERSEEHTSELQSRGLNSYAVFCLKKIRDPTHRARHGRPTLDLTPRPGTSTP